MVLVCTLAMHQHYATQDFVHCIRSRFDTSRGLCLGRTLITNLAPEEVFDGVHASIVYSVMQWSITPAQYYMHHN